MIVISKKDNKVTIQVVGNNAEGISGSCSVINYNGKMALFEVGSIQDGHDIKTNYNYNKNLISDIKDKNLISFIIVSHIHQDHVGNIPALYSNGCKAKIIIPKGNKNAIKDMWLDSAFINMREAESMAYKLKKEVAPLYDEQSVFIALNYIEEVPFHEIIKLDDSLSIRYIPAGHITFSAQAELFFNLANAVKKVTFSGDLGNINLKNENVFMDEFEPIVKTNVFIGECTYSKKGRDTSVKDVERDKQTIKELVHEHCIKKGRIILLPCFALDRCARLMWTLYSMFSDDLTFFTRIIIDSPLAIKLLNDYQISLTGDSKLKFDNMMNWKCFEFSKTALTSIEAMEDGEPKLIISSSGMLEGGRSVRWAKQLLPNKDDCIIFTGYATQNTNADKIKNGEGLKSLIITGDTVNKNCKIVDISSFSSHMQRKDLLNYYSNINSNYIYLVHGNKNDKEDFAQDLRNEVSKKNKTTNIICVDYKTKIIV